MGKPMTQTHEPELAGHFGTDEPGSMGSRPTPAVPIRIWVPVTEEEDEPTRVIAADQLQRACEMLKTEDEPAELLNFGKPAEPTPESQQTCTSEMPGGIGEQNLWD